MENTRPKIANDRQRKQCSREITTKTKRTPHHPYLRMYCHVLAARIAGEPPAFRGKPRFCEKNTVKRRKEKNDERKQGNGKTSGVKKALRLKFPEIPSAWGSCSRNTTTNWSGHTHLGERSTLLCPKGACPGRSSDGAPCETPTLRDQLQRPSGPPDHHRGLH